MSGSACPCGRNTMEGCTECTEQPLPRLRRAVSLRSLDPYWARIEANYTPAELRALILWAASMEELERRQWSRRVDR